MGERPFLERIIASLEQAKTHTPMVQTVLNSDQLQLFMQCSGMTAWITDVGGRLVFVSSKYLEVFQTPYTDVDEVIGKTVFDLFPSGVATDLLNNIQQVVASGEILEVIETVPLKDGKTGDFLVRKFPVNEKPILIGGIAIDITEYRHGEGLIRQSENRLKLALEASGDGLWDWDLENDKLFWNETFVQMFDYKTEELQPDFTQWKTMIHPDDLVWVTERLKAHLERGEPYAFDYRIKTKNGGWKWVANYGKVVAWDKNGKPARMIGTHRDVSARKQAESELQTANQNLSRLVDELEKRNAEIELLNSLSDVLQSCSTTQEAYKVVGDLISPVLEGSGGIYLLNSSRTLAECVSTWNGSPKSKELFGKENCWALKRGKTHYVELEKQPSLICQHSDPENGCTLCVPLIAKGTPIGILHVTNPHVLTEIRRRLISAVAESVALAFANLHLYETLQNESIRDPLTGLFNRRYMEESLSREIYRAARNQQPLCVAMLDVDLFKQYNDSYGHDAGDAVLRGIGDLLLERIRNSDIACRYGGEELLLILPETNLEGCFTLLEEMRKAVNGMSIEYQRRKLGAVTISIGLALYPEHGETQKELLIAADKALYEAKHRGRNQVVVFKTPGALPDALKVLEVVE